MDTTADRIVVTRTAWIGEAYERALARAAAHLSRRYGRAAAPMPFAGASYEEALAQAAARLAVGNSPGEARSIRGEADRPDLPCADATGCDRA